MKHLLLNMAVCAFVAMICLMSCGCEEAPAPSADSSPVHSPQPAPPLAPPPEPRIAQQAVSHEEVVQFCGACHVTPLPESFPRHAWYDEVRRGFEFYYDSGRRDLSVPSQTSVVQYFQTRAPESLNEPQMPERDDSALKFRRVGLQLEPSLTTNNPPAISFLSSLTDPSGSTELLVSDMRSGWFGQLTLPHDISAVGTSRDPLPLDQPCTNCVACPSAIRVVDLTGNGIADVVVGDLGSFMPEDHQKGQVLLIPNAGTPQAGPPVVLLSGIGRVADVQAADFNGDGRTDLVIAEFGWHTTGGIHLLLATEPFQDASSFEHRLLDDRSGAIHVIPADLNQDGRLDIVALLSQEHEQIVAYLNQPDGSFDAVTVYAAPDPSWGSSGIVLADMDGDGDTDIIYTNGDAFDSYLVKPYHGIRWIENLGNMKFATHEVGAMPGVHRAIPVDLDLDGDMDLVASALLPEKTRGALRPELRHGLVWFEQTAPGQFERHVIERDQPYYAAAIVVDVNGDQRPDIVTGCFMDSSVSPRNDLHIFFNEQP